MFLNFFFTSSTRPDEGSSTEARVLRIQSNDTLDVKYGFDRYKEPVDRLGWLINMHPVSQTFFTFLSEKFSISKEKRISEKRINISSTPQNLDQSFSCNAIYSYYHDQFLFSACLKFLVA